MNTRPDTITTATRTERLLGIGKSRPRSRFSLALSALLVALGGGSILRLVLSEGWNEQGFLPLGTLLLGLWLLSDVGGSLLYVRRGTGRALRIFGFAVFFPLAIVSGLTHSWFTAPPLFVAQIVLLLLTALVLGAIAVVRRARKNWAARQDG